MTLDEAIRHCEEVAQEKRYEYQDCLEAKDREAARECIKCGLQHRQLAEWLKELKQLREQTRRKRRKHDERRSNPDIKRAGQSGCQCYKCK